MPRPRERVYTLDKQKKHLARLSLLSAKRFRFNDQSHTSQDATAVWDSVHSFVVCFIFFGKALQRIPGCLQVGYYRH